MAAKSNSTPITAYAAEARGSVSEAQTDELRPVAISAFKNGLAFVLKQGSLRLDGGTGNISPVPQATLGTLWLGSSDGTIDEVIAGKSKVVKRRDIANMAELLMANVGKTLTLIDNRQKEYTGEIVGLTASSAVPTPLATDAIAIPKNIPDMLLMRSGGKLLALKLYAIESVVLPPDPILQVAGDPQELSALRFRVKGASGHANVSMGYLEHGFGWTPSYLVSLTDDHTAQITMQSVVVNDAEDVKDAEVFFVVGVPNFLYSNTMSPMALQSTLLDFMQSAGSMPRRDMYSNALRAQKAEVAMDAAASPVQLGMGGGDLSGAPEEDLFLYSRKGVTLARGERGMYNVFTAQVNYEHVYEWQVADRPKVDAYGNLQQSYQQNDDASQEVWHSIRLKDSTNFPWTSAPATVISNNKPLSQDTLPYTPKGANSNLRLTIATDVRVQSNENEVDRQIEAPRRNGYRYDVVTIEGKLHVKNYKTKEIKLRIAKAVRGEVLAQSDLGKSEKLGEGIAATNPMSQMKWEVSLKPGEERVVTYRYKVWVRS